MVSERLVQLLRTTACGGMIIVAAVWLTFVHSMCKLRQAWLGFYNSSLRVLGWEKDELVRVPPPPLLHSKST